MLACDKMVTLVRCDGMTFTCMMIEGVSWFDKRIAAIQEKGLAVANEVKIRIPAANLPPGVMPRVGDVVVLGAVDQPIARPADMDSYRHAKVLAVGDNRRGRLPHVAVSCG